MEKIDIGLNTKGTLQKIINKDNAKLILEKLKKYRKIIKEFFGDREHEKIVVGIVAIITMIGLTLSIVQIVQQAQNLHKESINLNKIEKYDIQALKQDSSMQSMISASKTIEDLLSINSTLENEITRYEAHKKGLQSSYSNFLQYLLVPKLNIRKEAYTDKININLLGKKFLENNPFNDINLYQKRANFFSSTEKNQINNIENLEIGEVKESDYGLYKIKISFDFTTPSKNALLFLIDKISMSSDKENISLLGEFVYYLRQQIKNDKEQEISDLMKNEENKELGNDENKIIGKELYQWVSNDKDTSLIDEKVINKTISNLMECGKGNDAECFYKFREKYRNIAELAYTIGSTNNLNKANDLKLFFKNMPPLMTIQTFSFDKEESNEALNNTVKYAGNASIEIYGQNISPGDIEEIAKELNKKCFGEEGALNTSIAIKKINEKLKVEDIENKEENQKKVSRISEFKEILDKIEKEYGASSNYKKTIRLFEIYRMLNEGGFCTTI